MTSSDRERENSSLSMKDFPATHDTAGSLPTSRPLSPAEVQRVRVRNLPEDADAAALSDAIPWLVIGVGSVAYGKERRAVTSLKHMPRIRPHFLTTQWEDGTVSELLRAHGFEFTPTSLGYLGRARWRWTLLNIRLMPRLFRTVLRTHRQQRCPGVLVLA